jgi:hypothetical protein
MADGRGARPDVPGGLEQVGNVEVRTDLQLRESIVVTDIAHQERREQTCRGPPMESWPVSAAAA